MEIIKVKMQITDDGLTFEEKTDLIIAQLRELANHIEECKGNVQMVRCYGEGIEAEYVHLKEV